jgi:hypothetical protein
MGITPSGLRDRPSLDKGDHTHLDGYRFLTRSRTYSEVGPNPITVSEVRSYLQLVEEDRVEERLKFLRFVQDMDSVYLEHAAAKQAESIKNE